MKPVENAQADELRNRNINAADGQEFADAKDNKSVAVDTNKQGE